MRRFPLPKAAASVLTALFFFAVFCAVVPSASQAKVKFGLTKGYNPPPFTAKDVNGHEQSLETYTGQVVVLHFWASWCPYCRGEIAKLMQLYQEKQVQIIAVSTDENVDVLKRFLEKVKLPYPVIADSQNDFEISDQYAISGIPVTFIINRDGTIFKRLNGSSDIVGTVKQALTQSSSKAT